MRQSVLVTFGLLSLCGLATDARAALKTVLYASGFELPVAFLQDPTDASRQFVVEQGGRIRVVASGTVLATDFLDLSSVVSSGAERGLLGMVVAPDYATSGRFFVNFTNENGDTVVARFRRSDDPLVADPASRFDLRWGGAGGQAFIAQPYANHNGGNLAFGPDGFLYIGLGDGGASDDPGNRSQSPSELLGKMLRIDVDVPDDDPSGYRVPSSNPFVAGGPAGTLPEIWSFGLRNPWRYTFDDPARGGTGALIIGDVGQAHWEEIDFEPPDRGGRNYGWRFLEGTHENVTSTPPELLPLVDPIYEYDHEIGQSITGGYVYRGHLLGAAYRGRYFFADFVRGRVWSMALTIDPATGEGSGSAPLEHTGDLGGPALGNISSFGLDADGEMYLLNYESGIVLKVVDDTVTVAHPSRGTWLVRDTETGTATTLSWGIAGDVPVAGDFDGDGRIDFAVFRPSDGTWWIRYTGSTAPTSFQWGNANDLPLVGDFNGDGKSDLVIFRPADGTWWIWYTGLTAPASFQWGMAGDVPLVGDFNGDGRSDIAVYRPSDGTWWVWYTGSTASTWFQWGMAGDVPVPGDFDGDGKTDLAVFRPSDGTWWIWYTGSLTSASFQWGIPGDVPVVGDFNGDGKADITIFRPSNGIWWVWYTGISAAGSFQWGDGSDVLVPGDFGGDHKTDVALFRLTD